jgi:hypothetical protein
VIQNGGVYRNAACEEVFDEWNNISEFDKQYAEEKYSQIYFREDLGYWIIQDISGRDDIQAKGTFDDYKNLETLSWNIWNFDGPSFSIAKINDNV